ncbi:MAG: helix-turn-helix domain-containing protein [Bryobacterales bacterium]|jgi:cytoskeleton protein RodZ|nr:helix-turn-helix domain-containing protein [Bryobacterales bacterium]
MAKPTNQAAHTQPETLPLAALRRQKGLSLHQIADSTKISIRWLQAIEQGDFAKLPGGVYSTNYLRQYARIIDFDEHELLRYYYRRTGIEPPGQPAAEPERKPVSRLFRSPLAAFRL